MRLSILDQSPIPSGKTASDALNTSLKLAKLGDKFGYKRFWIAEHHDLFGLACPNPDVMIGVIGAQTKQIIIGAGAVLLPYYKPFRVAETYNLLETLFPGRIDLGLGRAPGGSAEVSLALTDNYLEEVRKYPGKIDELIDFLQRDDNTRGATTKILPTPIPILPPTVWMLGTSKKSAHLAAEKGMPYAFGHFMTSEDGVSIVNTYRDRFKRSELNDHPEVIIAVTVVCAQTDQLAEEIAQSVLLWQLQQKDPTADNTIPSLQEVNEYNFTKNERLKVEKLKEKMVIGNPISVKEKLIKLRDKYEANELMIVTITHDEADKFNSYRLIIEQFDDQ